MDHIEKLTRKVLIAGTITVALMILIQGCILIISIKHEKQCTSKTK